MMTLKGEACGEKLCDDVFGMLEEEANEGFWERIVGRIRNKLRTVVKK
jgi:hypothetical protein